MTSISPKVGSSRSVRKRFTSPTMQLSSGGRGWACHLSASSTMKVHSEGRGNRVSTCRLQRKEVRPVFPPEPDNCTRGLSLSQAGERDPKPGKEFKFTLDLKWETAFTKASVPKGTRDPKGRRTSTRPHTATEGTAGPKQTARNQIALFSLNPSKPREKESASGTTGKRSQPRGPL